MRSIMIYIVLGYLRGFLFGLFINFGGCYYGYHASNFGRR